jgi:hypothetical protein
MLSWSLRIHGHWTYWKDVLLHKWRQLSEIQMFWVCMLLRRHQRKSSWYSFRSNRKGGDVEMLIIDASIVIHSISKTTLNHNGRQHHHLNYTWDGECQTSLPLNLQLVVRVRIAYLRYLCLFENNGFQHIFCSFFLRRVIPYVASFSGLSFLIAPSIFSNVIENKQIKKLDGIWKLDCYRPAMIYVWLCGQKHKIQLNFN